MNQFLNALRCWMKRLQAFPKLLKRLGNMKSQMACSFRPSAAKIGDVEMIANMR
jgi:hypothetical protein